MRFPKLHRHAASGQAFVRVSGQKPVYFGRWPEGMKRPPAEVEQAYRHWLGEWMRANAPAAATGRPRLIRCPSVGELWEIYYAHARVYYRKNGVETSEVNCIKRACRIAARLYGALPAEQFGAQELLACRDEMVRLGWLRESINKHVFRIQAMFRWAGRVEQGRMVPMAVYYDLRDVKPLVYGRCTVPEGDGREPVAMALVKATLPHCSVVVAAMVRVQYLLACRCQDVRTMRPCDIDRTADPVDGAWLYTPDSGKSDHHLAGSKAERKAGKLCYWIGPRAQAILLPLIVKAGGDASTQWLFPSRRVAGIAQHFTAGSYTQHVARACALAGVPHWTPYQLRHTRMTETGEALGTESAQRLVDHKRLSTTEIYAKKTREARRRIALDMDERDQLAG